MMKRTVVLLVAVLATAGVSVLQLGCGRSSEAPPAAQVAPAAPAEAPAPAPEPAPAAPPPAAQAPAAPAPRTAARPQSASPSPAPVAAAPAPAPAAPAPPPPPPPPRVFTMRQGTPITVFTTSTLSTKSNKTGETFSAVLAKPIMGADDWVIAKQGARVEGVIVDSDPGGRVKGVASMTLALRRLTLADGRTIELDTNTVIQDAKSSKGKDARRVGIGAGVGAAIGAIAGGGSGAAAGAAIGGGAGTAATLATRGDPAEFAAESELNFTLSTPVSVTEKK